MSENPFDVLKKIDKVSLPVGPEDTVLPEDEGEMRVGMIISPLDMDQLYALPDNEEPPYTYSTKIIEYNTSNGPKKWVAVNRSSMPGIRVFLDKKPEKGQRIKIVKYLKSPVVNSTTRDIAYAEVVD